MDDIDPMNYAGENFSSADEIPRAEDIRNNPWLLGRIIAGGDEDYWPPPAGKKR